jgi:hypothetical protein
MGCGVTLIPTLPGAGSLSTTPTANATDVFIEDADDGITDTDNIPTGAAANVIDVVDDIGDDGGSILVGGAVAAALGDDDNDEVLVDDGLDGVTVKIDGVLAGEPNVNGVDDGRAAPNTIAPLLGTGDMPPLLTVVVVGVDDA